MTVTNETNGVELRIFPGTNSGVNLPSYVQREINGHFLTPECGEAFQKCNLSSVNISATATSEQGSHVIVIVPLLKAVGLLSFNVDNIDINDIHVVVKEFPQYDCSPSSVYHIHNGYYIVCSNSEINYIRLLELRLNSTHLENSYVSDLENLHVNSVHNMTNSLYINLPSRSGSHIIFANEYTIFYFKPLDYLVDEFSIRLDDWECFATAIDYIGGWEMIVYCDNKQAVYINLNQELIFASVEYGKDGEPYICPNPDVYLAVYEEAEYIQYAFRSTNQVKKNYELSMNQFDNGVCLGSTDVTLFAFTDREQGTRLLDASGGSVKSLSHTTCINYPCRPLLVLQDRYLVVREKREGSWYISIFDSRNNFSLAWEAKHSSADLMALVESDISGNCTPVAVSSHVLFASSVPIANPQINSPAHTAIISISVVGGFVIVVSCVITVILCVVGKTRKTWRHVLAVSNVGFEQLHNSAMHSNLVVGIAMEGI